MTTATLPAVRKIPTTIPAPRAEWFVPVDSRELAWAAADPVYRGFHEVSRQVGAWASSFPSDRAGKYFVELPAFVHVPLSDDLPVKTEGEAKTITERGRVVCFDFRAKLVGIVFGITVLDGYAKYAVEMLHPDREFDSE